MIFARRALVCPTRKKIKKYPFRQMRKNKKEAPRGRAERPFLNPAVGRAMYCQGCFRVQWEWLLHDAGKPWGGGVASVVGCGRDDGMLVERGGGCLAVLGELPEYETEKICEEGV
jgi:hypothetical protein